MNAWFERGPLGRKKIPRRTIAALAFLFLFFTPPARGYSIHEGSITVEKKDDSTFTVTTWSGQSAPTDVSVDTQIVISGDSSTPNTIFVDIPQMTAKILLDSVDISSVGPGGPAFLIQKSSSVDLTLSGYNFLKSGQNSAGLQMAQDNTLIISANSASASLTATGGMRGAGIGGGYNNDSGNISISISGGTVSASGGMFSAGIGGGYDGSGSGGGGNISISGGTVFASGGMRGAGIGGGFTGGGNISISGGTVHASGGDYGAGIGGGDNGGGGNIFISGGTVFASGGADAMDIGPGHGGSEGTITITGGSVKPARALSAFVLSDCISPYPVKGNANTDAYLNILTVGASPVKSADITACVVDNGGISYGIKDVKTDDEGKLYFWLPKNTGNTSGNVTVTVAGGDRYGLAWSRNAASEDQTLIAMSILALDRSTHTFDSRNAGYSELPDPCTVTVSNDSSFEANNLSADIGGANPSAFTLKWRGVTNIGTGKTTSFDVRPRTGLAANTYTATVTVRADNADAQTFTVKFPVLEKDAAPIPATGVTLNKTTLSLKVGESETLTATVKPDDATNKDVTWKSSNPAAATAGVNGRVTGVSPGNASVTVATTDGKHTASCAVTVTKTEITVNWPDGLENGLTLKPGDEIDLTLTGTPDGLKFSAAGLPQWLTLTEDGHLYGTVPENIPDGTRTVTLTVTAPDGTTKILDFTVTVKSGEPGVTGGGCGAGAWGLTALLFMAWGPLRRKF